MKRKSKIHFITGFILGAVIFGSISAYATGILAQKSTQQIAINGIIVPVEAYNIEGRNYVQLRDIANKTNKFAFDYDEVTATVLIDTNLPYINFDTGEINKVTTKPTVTATPIPEEESNAAQPVSHMTKAGDIIN